MQVRAYLPQLLLAGAISTSVTEFTLAQDTTGELENVTVTATPLNDAFQVSAGAFGDKGTMEVPLAIKSYGADTIAETSPRTALDLLAVDPSVLNSSYGGGFDNFRLRGFVMDNFNTIRRDGLALAPHYDMPLELIERVDVLKGPSGFLYGFNSPGGTINYIPKRPTRDPFTCITLQGSSLQDRYLTVDTSAAVAENTIGYRLNAGYQKTGDFDHLGDLERKFAGLAADFRLNERALLQLNTDWALKSAMTDPLLRADQSGRTDPLDPSSFVLPPEVDRRDGLSPSWYQHETEAHNLEAKLDYRLNDDWTSITQANYSRVERHGGYADIFDVQPNGDIGYADLYASRGEVFTNWSVQSYLAGAFVAAGLQHDLFAGAAYRQFRDRSPFWDFVDSTGGISVGDISVGNILEPIQPPRWNFGPEQEIDFNASIRERSLFASDLITLDERFQLLLGGRQIWYSARELSAAAPPQDESVFVPTGALMYRPAAPVMAYVSYSRGFEKGEYSPYNANNPNQPTDAIASEQVEIGLKVGLHQDFNAGVALFDIRRDASYLNTNNDFVSSGRFHHRGIELDATANVNSNFTLLGNIAYLDTELEDVIDPATLGKRSEGAPRWKSTLSARYAFTALPGFSLDSTLRYVGSRPVDTQNSGFIPGYTLWDAGASYETSLGDTPTTFRLHGKNLTDKYYYPGVIYSGGLEVGRMREIFLSARFDI
ncbi:TonB-dependent siderophore receptor [Microbulbifer harenosus]|uniref:TonB-dependent siderophore receptor n=1 Tax=Microbulbifer harenosus TaxID=2576840 RepID=A0ABY2UPH0_9GAMM|nr:TonB-dependent siderophore receptor [Microbulbifer harenosus]TLM78132.1 TonB-dependent siderophore receptor [Microbulbifer harenosus]